MDDRFTPGRIVTSGAGHDRGEAYMVVACDGGYVYVADGRLKPVNTPKKKKIKHLRYTNHFDNLLAGRFERGETVRDEEIRRSIKAFMKMGGN